MCVHICGVYYLFLTLRGECCDAPGVRSTDTLWTGFALQGEL